ncbi:MAG TPA: ERCC4 domain-containing protein [Acidimicrobiales bacterium]|nr:ERCC4 domain-containing protein [Acidimicrobiales bacterium]
MFRTSDVWPRTKALYCHPVPLADWPAEPDVVEEVAVRSCVRRGAAIDLVLDRARENRSQLVYTKARGRDVVFWQSPRTRKQARPNVRTPTARAAGLDELEIVVDAHERYAWQFAAQSAVRTTKRALPCGDYGVTVDGRLVAAVERKSLDDLTSSLSSGRLRFAVTELAGLPRAAVVVESRWSDVFKQRWVRPSVIAEGIAELQVRWPAVPIVFCETRALAEEWTYRFLAAAAEWARTEPAAAGVAADGVPDPAWAAAPTAPEASTAEVRRWARAAGLPVAAGGRLRPEIWAAWRASQEAQASSAGSRAE